MASLVKKPVACSAPFVLLRNISHIGNTGQLCIFVLYSDLLFAMRFTKLFACYCALLLPANTAGLFDDHMTTIVTPNLVAHGKPPKVLYSTLAHRYKIARTVQKTAPSGVVPCFLSTVSIHALGIRWQQRVLHTRDDYGTPLKISCQCLIGLTC